MGYSSSKHSNTTYPKLDKSSQFNTIILCQLTKLKIFSDCVIKAILDHPYCFMACTIPTTIAASLDTVLTKFGNVLSLERRGDDDAGEI